MTAVDSRLKRGTLLLGVTPGLDISCQVTNCRIKSNYNTDDSQETLCGDVLAGATTLKSRSLAGTVIQDFDDDTGFIEWCFANDLTDQSFTFTPNQTGAPTYTGIVTVQVPDETSGGDVNTRLTSDFDWQMSGLTRVYGTTATADAEAAAKDVATPTNPAAAEVA